MSQPNEDPDELLDQTAKALDLNRTALPPAAAAASVAEWLEELDGEADPAVKRLVTDLQKLLPMVSGNVINDPAIKTVLKDVSLHLMAIADAIPNDPTTGERPRRKQRMSDMSYTLAYMSL